MCSCFHADDLLTTFCNVPSRYLSFVQQVGTYMKTPKYPIWVICSESHFSVLFCLRRELLNDWKAERRFELYYYDGLAKQDEEIKLSIGSSNFMTFDAFITTILCNPLSKMPW